MMNKYSYQDAFSELQEIVSDIQQGEVSVDELTQKISRASELITICNAKLTASEKEVEKLLLKLDESSKQVD